MTTRQFRQSDRIVLDVPLLVIEILSPDDVRGDTLQRFREYEKLGVRYIVLMDSQDRLAFTFVNGDLVQRDLSSFELPGGSALPFNSRELFARLDEE